MVERIKKLMEAENMTSAKFADTIQIQRAIISHIFTRRNRPSLELVIKILSAFPSVNPEWLIQGCGSMYKEKTISKEQDDDSYMYGDLFNENRKSTTIHQDSGENFKENELNKSRKEPNLLDNQTIIEKNLSQKKIVKIIVFYSDNTFETFS